MKEKLPSLSKEGWQSLPFSDCRGGENPPATDSFPPGKTVFAGSRSQHDNAAATEKGRPLGRPFKISLQLPNARTLPFHDVCSTVTLAMRISRASPNLSNIRTVIQFISN